MTPRTITAILFGVTALIGLIILLAHSPIDFLILIAMFVGIATLWYLIGVVITNRWDVWND